MAARLKPFRCPECGKAIALECALADHRRDRHDVVLVTKTKGATQGATDPCCIECGKVATLVGGDAVYPHRPDLFHKRFWLCECGAYCGCHGATTRPLGFPCGYETRQARMAAHDVFDPIWRSGEVDRRGAYTWLADALGIKSEDCHIGMMSAERAYRVVELCEARRAAA